MTIALDHFLILTDPGAPRAADLTRLGLVEGSPNDHPGQGTSNRRFFFSDAMLELLYVRDPNEAAKGPGSRLRLVERAADPAASPFGLIFRTAAGSTHEPFAGWQYHPDYLDADQYLYIGENSDLTAEPLCVVIPAIAPPLVKQPLSPAPFISVTNLIVSVPVVQPSSVLKSIAHIERISLRPNEPHRMEIVFDDQRQGQSRDFRPALPLVIRW